MGVPGNGMRLSAAWGLSFMDIPPLHCTECCFSPLSNRPHPCKMQHDQREGLGHDYIPVLL